VQQVAAHPACDGSQNYNAISSRVRAAFRLRGAFHPAKLAATYLPRQCLFTIPGWWLPVKCQWTFLNFPRRLHQDCVSKTWSLSSPLKNGANLTHPDFAQPMGTWASTQAGESKIGAEGASR